MGFGMGAGAVSVVATVLALGPVVQGDVAKTKEAETAKSVARTEGKARKVDRNIKIVMRGGSYLGVRLQDVDAEETSRLNLPEEKGALVTRVEDDSPAAEAGLKTDDVIVRYHGESVLGATQLARLVRETPVGRKVPLEVVRGGSTVKLTATLGGDREDGFDVGRGGEWEMEVPEPHEFLGPHAAPVLPKVPNLWRGGPKSLDRMVWFGQGPRKLGLEYQEISGQLAEYFKLSADEGVLVTSVEADGPAAKAGLKAGDVILKVGSRSVEDGEDLRRAIEKAEPGRETTVTVQRDGRSLDLKVTPAGPRRERDRSGTDL
jgi:serine protease Do